MNERNEKRLSKRNVKIWVKEIKEWMKKIKLNERDEKVLNETKILLWKIKNKNLSFPQ